MKYSGHRKLLCKLSKLSKFSCITTLLKLKYSHKHLARFNTKLKDPKNDYSFYQQNCTNQWSCTSLVHDKVQNWLQFEFYLQTQFCLQNRDLIKHSVLFTIHSAVYLRYTQLFIYKQRFIYNQSFLYRDVFENRDQVRPYPSKLKAVTILISSFVHQHISHTKVLTPVIKRISPGQLIN